MSSPKIHRIFHTIILCTLLITHQLTNASFSEKFDFTAYQYYIIACITSCCIGALLCTLIQKYCCKQSTIIPEKNSQKENAKQQLIEQLHQKIDTTQTTIELIRENEKKTINLLIEHNNSMNQIINLCRDNVQTNIANIATKIKFLRQKEKEFLEFSQLLKNNNTNLFIASTLYWFEQCKEKTKECEIYKEQFTNNSFKTIQLQTDQYPEM